MIFISVFAIAVLIFIVVRSSKRASVSKLLGVVILFTVASIGVIAYWRSAMLTISIVLVCVLAIGVAYQKIAAPKAIISAIAAFILIFVFSWLAIQLSKVFLFGQTIDMSSFTGSATGDVQYLIRNAITNPIFLTAFSLACIITSRYMNGWLKSVLLFVGVIAIVMSTPTLLEYIGLDLRHSFADNDATTKIVILAMILTSIVVIVRISRSS